MNDKDLLRRVQEEVEAGYIREGREGDLAVFKYTQQCVIDGHWNKATLAARGLVFNMVTGQRLTRPFTKFFNMEERPGTRFKYLPKGEFEVFEKLDGSCGIGYYYNGWKLTTPGGLSSEQAFRGMAMFDRYDWEWLNERRRLGFNVTPIWEIIYPDLDNIVNYGDREELCLLTVFDLDTGEEYDSSQCDKIAAEAGFPRPIRYTGWAREDLLAPPFKDNAEGFVVRFKNGLRVKIKDPRYVKAHKLLSGSTAKRVIEIMSDPDMDIAEVQESLSGAFRASLDDVIALVRQTYNKVEGAILAHHNRLKECVETASNFKETRKRQALWIQENVPNSLRGCIFGLLDDRDIRPTIWKLTEEVLHDNA